jgi:putative ABC transport system permease protein
MGNFWQDVRYGVRVLTRKPGLTVVAILTLALGIGVNTSIFSLVNAVLLRPLPYDEADLLVAIHEWKDGQKNSNSGHEFIAWRDQNRTLERVAMYSYAGFNLTGTGNPEALMAVSVTADFFAVLRQRTLLGRPIATGDDQPNADRIVVLSHKLWQRRFGTDSSVVGRAVRLNDLPYTIVGVMPARGETFDPDIWVPMNLPDEAIKIGKHSNAVIGRLLPNVTIARAQSDIARISRRLEQELPADNTGHGVLVKSAHEDVVGNMRRPLLVFMGAVAFILLIACANVAHLLLTRAAVRDRELAIRTALGAGRGRLLRQLLTESLLLGLAGGATGMLLAAWVIDVLPSFSAWQLPRLDEVRIDRRVLGITVALSLLTGIVSGIVPALQSTRMRSKLRTWLAEGSKMTLGPGRRLAGFLIVSEVALALVLLVGAGLTIKSFARLTAVDAGFRPDNVLTLEIGLPPTRYADGHRVLATFDQLFQRIRALPGVQHVGATSQIPLGRCCSGTAVTIEGKPAPPPGQEDGAELRVVTDGYFSALGIRLRNGRFFRTSDARLAVPLIRWWPGQPNPARFDEPQAAPVAIINEAMARQHWPNQDPVGKRFRVLFSPWVTVVGVVDNVRQQSLSQSAMPEFYLAHSQEPWADLTIAVRSSRDPVDLMNAVREQVRAVDPDLPIRQMLGMDQLLRNSVSRPRFNALLLGVAGGVALLLALIGIYGVMSYSVARRTHEIGIRSALGADRSDVLKLVLGRAMTLAGTGIALGIAGALVLTQALQKMLFEVEPTDPLVFASIALLLAAVCLLASYLPMRRATRVDPLVALRSD